MLEGKERMPRGGGGQSSGRWPSLNIQLIEFITHGVYWEGEREPRGGGQSSGRWPSLNIQFIPFIMYNVSREGKGGGGGVNRVGAGPL
jgi:hypothetical protein